jgi:catechol 2,3-dioxygenase-like lactoylglutathione lyase family enzyme
VLAALSRVGLEVKYLDRARAFYAGQLGLSPAREDEAEFAVRVGETDVVCRRPGGVTDAPRGGLHVHYAMAVPPGAYESWVERFGGEAATQVDFGAYRSAYVDDPDDHCVEVGSNGEPGGSDPTGVFEVVLEVTDLARAEACYRALGFEVVDRGSERRRVRLDGPVELELWEPHLGLADARGGVHVDLAFEAADPAAAADAVADWTVDRQAVAGGVRVRDADCHDLTFLDGD